MFKRKQNSLKSVNPRPSHLFVIQFLFAYNHNSESEWKKLPVPNESYCQIPIKKFVISSKLESRNGWVVKSQLLWQCGAYYFLYHTTGKKILSARTIRNALLKNRRHGKEKEQIALAACRSTNECHHRSIARFSFSWLVSHKKTAHSGTSVPESPERIFSYVFRSAELDKLSFLILTKDGWVPYLTIVSKKPLVYWCFSWVTSRSNSTKFGVSRLFPRKGYFMLFAGILHCFADSK